MRKGRRRLGWWLECVGVIILFCASAWEIYVLLPNQDLRSGSEAYIEREFAGSIFNAVDRLGELMIATDRDNAVEVYQRNKVKNAQAFQDDIERRRKLAETQEQNGRIRGIRSGFFLIGTLMVVGGIFCKGWEE